MKKHIIVTLILLIAAAFVTVVYFKNLNTPGTRTSRVMSVIPSDASLIFEFGNDHGFYDIFAGNKLFTAVAGQQTLGELDTLRRVLLLNQALAPYFDGQNIFISVHPSKTDKIGLLLTITAGNGFERSMIEQLPNQTQSGLLVTPLHTAGKPGYNIYIAALKKRFYLINVDKNTFSGSFSREMAEESALYKKTKNRQSFVLLSEAQSANSLANLYINYGQLTPLFDQLFRNRNTDIFKSFRLLPGLGALSLNYKTDALMFNGSTAIQAKEAASYLNLFTGQQPVVNHLKDIFPSTTAYSTTYSVSDPVRFGADLSKWYLKAGLKNEEDQLFNKIMAETGTNIQADFTNLLGNEFAVITTRYFEKFAIISVKDGSKLNLLLANISLPTSENQGQLNYEKLPFFLLGDAFSMFRKPYFLIIDNYLIFANSKNELASYYDTYINRKFLSKNAQYNEFDNLLAARSNIAFLLNFRNAEPVFKRDLDTGIYNSYKKNEPGWKDFYGASWQFTAADKDFYTNFCMRLNTDTAAVKN